MKRWLFGCIMIVVLALGGAIAQEAEDAAGDAAEDGAVATAPEEATELPTLVAAVRDLPDLLASSQFQGLKETPATEVHVVDIETVLNAAGASTDEAAGEASADDGAAEGASDADAAADPEGELMGVLEENQDLIAQLREELAGVDHVVRALEQEGIALENVVAMTLTQNDQVVVYHQAQTEE